MTSSKMENPLWKKLQNDPLLLKFQQLNNGSMPSVNGGVGAGVSNNGGSNSSSVAMNMNMLRMLNESGGGVFGNGGGGGGGNGMLNGDEMSMSSKGGGATAGDMAMGNEAAFQQMLNHTLLASGSNSPSHFMKQQQQQQQSNPAATAGYASHAEQQNQHLQQLQHFLNSAGAGANNTNNDFYANNTDNNPESFNNLMLNQPSQFNNYANGSNNVNNTVSSSNYQSFDSYALKKPSSVGAPGSVQREVGVVEKMFASYGFVKCLDRDARLFFHHTSYQNGGDDTLKIGDLVEFEEDLDKRNGKPIATNLRRTAESNIDDSTLNLMNLKELLLKNKASEQQHQQQQHYQTIMNGLKMLNMQQSSHNEAATNNLNSILSLINKENTVNQQQLNLLNMAKSAAAGMSAGHGESVNLSHLAKLLSLNSLPTVSEVSRKNEFDSGSEQMEGTIAVVAMKPATRPIVGQFATTPAQLDGRITCQRNGETFYIPYSLSDVVGFGHQLRIGDRVKFCVAHLLNNNAAASSTSALPIVSGYYARRVELLGSPPPKQLYRGVISTLKDSFGKIEREDALKETFFHFTEYRGQSAAHELKLGLNVEFELQDRHGKEIACNIHMLPEGTVSFDEMGRHVHIGRVIQPLNLDGNGLGRLIYDKSTDETNTGDEAGLVQLSFGFRDRTGEYTLLEGDFVQFRIATDKRRGFQRATQLSLIEEHSLVENSLNTNEHRERGVLVKICSAQELIIAAQNGLAPQQLAALDNHLAKIKYGVIKCLEHNELAYFCMSEVINYARFSSSPLPNGKTNTTYTINEVRLEVGDSLEFSVLKFPKDFVLPSGLQAIRIRQLAKNSVRFELISGETYTGYVEREVPSADSAKSGGHKHHHHQSHDGLVRFEYKNGSSFPTTKIVPYQLVGTGGGDSEQPSTVAVFYVGDKVQFNLCTCVKTQKQHAVNLKLVEACKEQGFVTMLKENYGFIEFAASPRNNKQAFAAPRDIFFHISSLLSSANDLEVGDEVEFTVNQKNRAKMCAENVSKVASGSIKAALSSPSSPAVYKGRILQQLRSHCASTIPSSNSQEQSQLQVDEIYYGKVQVTSSGSADKKDSSSGDSVYQFGLFSLSDKKVALQVGDLVTFQLVTNPDGSKRIVCMQLQQEQPQQQQQQSHQQRSRTTDHKKGRIESIKGHCGYIEYTSMNGEITSGKKVFFHISDFIESANTTMPSSNGSDASCSLKVGDEVEFILMHNSRTGKYSAVKIKRVGSSGQKTRTESNSVSSSSSSSANEATAASADPAAYKRPERLITKLKVANIDNKSGKQLVLIRQPNNPDGKTKSFSRQMRERSAGALEYASEDSAPIADEKSATVSSMSIVDLLMASNSN